MRLAELVELYDVVCSRLWLGPSGATQNDLGQSGRLLTPSPAYRICGSPPRCLAAVACAAAACVWAWPQSEARELERLCVPGSWLPAAGARWAPTSPG